MEQITLNQIAKQLGVSPQAVYQKVDKQLNNQLINHKKTFQKGNRTITVYTSEGAEIIKRSFTSAYINKEKPVEQVIEQKVEQEVEQPKYANANQSDLLSVIEVLNNQLKVKDKQIEALNQQLSTAMQMNQNQQVLLLNEQQNKMLGTGQQQEQEKEIKKGLFSIFKRNNKE